MIGKVFQLVDNFPTDVSACDTKDVNDQKFQSYMNNYHDVDF